MGKYILNTWYPAAWSRDITHSLATSMVAEHELVLFRATDGTVVVHEDACPHRLLPLSMGKLKDDLIECGYHGMTFDCSGSCVRIPGQAMIPNNARVRTFPTHENMGLVWVWLGDPELADRSKVYDLPQYYDPKWSSVEGDALKIASNYLSLVDNLCDPSHVSFVHLSSLGTPAGEEIPVHVDKTEDGLVTWRWINDAEPIPLFKKFCNFKGNVDRWHYYHYHAPSIAVIDFGSAETGTGAPEGNRDDCIQIFACHFIAPVDENTSVDYWLHVKNFIADDDTNKALSHEFRLAFQEDKAILEAIQVNEGKDKGWRRIKLAIDASPTRMRKMVQGKIDSEAV